MFQIPTAEWEAAADAHMESALYSLATDASHNRQRLTHRLQTDSSLSDTERTQIERYCELLKQLE